LGIWALKSGIQNSEAIDTHDGTTRKMQKCNQWKFELFSKLHRFLYPALLDKATFVIVKIFPRKLFIPTNNQSHQFEMSPLEYVKFVSVLALLLLDVSC
jgi:hypothetical protein